MSRLKAAAIAILSLLFAAFAFAQEPREEPKPPQQQQEEAKPEHKHDAQPARQNQNEMKPPRQEEPKPPRDEAKPPKAEKQDSAKPPHEEAKPGHEQHEERAQEQRHTRPAGKSAHIPDEKFHANFGREHTVVINRPAIVEGRPRFQFAGYWFEILDPWPADWAYTDDCYIDYIDGDYFLFDVLHPGVRIALFVAM